MNSASTAQKRVVVIGGGITGLAAAHRLSELDPKLLITLVEAGGRLGGVLQTVRRDGFLIERSADNFIANVPWAVELCRRIGFADQLIPTSSQQRNAFVVHNGRLEKVPLGFMLMAPSRIWPLLTTPILSPWGKVRLLGEYFVPRRKTDGDESLASFARRRLGREAFERIVQPLVGGIYTADPEKLSLEATLPRFVEMERRHGGLIRGALRQRTASNEEEAEASSGARYGLFVAPRDGLSSMVEAIAARLPPETIRLNLPIERITRGPDGRWSIHPAASARNPADLQCDAVIVTVGADCAAGLIESVDRELSANLGRIAYAGTTIVSLAYRRDKISHALDGFGFVVPAVEKRRILAGSFASVKFAGRAPDDMALVRVFVGGACQSEIAELPDDELRRIAADELRMLLGTRAEPAFCDIARWPRSMPQYRLGHIKLVSEIESAAAKWPHFALAGNAYHGVGIPNCIHSGRLAAERISASFEPA
ncbi:MAG TPA: protoporphyrinogen oxidase [Pirellulales bacterium]|nr:protoporphyrinogen oxidase [Pirellulales bacterium]